MKRFVGLIALIVLPLTSYGFSRIPSRNVHYDNLSIPTRFHSSGQTAMLEWGCPVSELVSATTPAEAITHVENGCRLEVSKAALQKPDVLEIIQTNAIWPDLIVSEEQGKFKLQGTFFFETLVLRNGGGY